MARMTPRPPALLSLCAATFVDPARAPAAALDELDSTISRLHEEADPARIVRIGMAACFVDRMPDCREAHWRVVRDGRDGGAVTSAILALLHLCFDDLFTGRGTKPSSWPTKASSCAKRTATDSCSGRCGSSKRSSPPPAVTTT
jgi:hypothetical protein